MNSECIAQYGVQLCSDRLYRDFCFKKDKYLCYNKVWKVIVKIIS